MNRLLLLCEYGTLNGGERSMLATLEGVAKAGFQVRVAAPSAGPLAAALHAQAVEHVAFEPRGPDGARLPLAQLREQLANLIRRERPDLVHANSLAMARVAGPVTAAQGVLGFGHLRDILKLSRQAIADLNCNDRLLAVSQATRAFHVSQGLDAAKTRVLYNGVDLTEFQPLPATGYLHRELGLSPDVSLLGTIGQISLRKGHDLLVRAFTQVASHTNAGLCIIGQRFSDKDESREFEADLHRAATGAFAGRLFFLGLRYDTSRLLNELTLLVHPARQEPLGRVLLEAAAAGLPVVATDVGGTCEIFPPACRAARLVAPEDAAGLADAIVSLLADPAERSRMSAAARCRVEQHFDRQQATETLVREYRGGLDRAS